MENKEALIEAIENCDIFTPHERKVIGTLIKISVDDVVITDIMKLSKISNISRPVVYKALAIAENHGLIEKVKNERKVLNIFKLKKIKLEDILKHYEMQKILLQDMKNTKIKH
jgi:hypothetical protein